MLRSSSKRACTSTRQTVCLPCSAARISAGTMGESPLVRYTVCLIARTLGSSTACSTNRSTLVRKSSYGWCTRMSPARIAAKMSRFSPSSGRRRGRVRGSHAGSRSSGRSMVASDHNEVKSSGGWMRKVSRSPTSRASMRSSTRPSGASSSTSSRTTCPNRRRRSWASTAPSRSSDSSEIEKSASRVTRNSELSSTSIPGKSRSTWHRMTSSSGTSRRSLTGRKRGSRGGTLMRAKRISPFTGSRTRSPKLSERPEMYGNGSPGPTASGVSTGYTSRSNCTSTWRRSAGLRSVNDTTSTPFSASSGSSSSRQMRLCSAISSRTRSVIRSSTSPRGSWSGVDGRRPASRASCTAATRTMKNSSRLLEKIARNLQRSSSGTSGLRARASTRALKSSQDTSRLM